MHNIERRKRRAISRRQAIGFSAVAVAAATGAYIYLGSLPSLTSTTSASSTPTTSTPTSSTIASSSTSSNSTSTSTMSTTATPTITTTTVTVTQGDCAKLALESNQAKIQPSSVSS
ncbi:MAG: twin-arginine translocation signal domain-containing protein [Nitrososphaeria archaeon]